MTSRPIMIISEDELKLRPEYYLNQVEMTGLTLLITRDGVIAAKIQPPDVPSAVGADAPD
jgi:hypothetical protein